MGRPRNQPGVTVDTRKRVMDAAKEELAINGLNIRLDDVAKRCKMRRPSLLHYFPSKQALVDAVTAELIVLAEQAISESVLQAKGDYFAIIAAITHSLRKIEAQERGVAAVLLHLLLSDEHIELFTMVENLVAFILKMVVDADEQSRHSPSEMQAVVMQVFMGELSRLALGAKAEKLWGSADAVGPIIQAYFFAGVPLTPAMQTMLAMPQSLKVVNHEG